MTRSAVFRLLGLGAVWGTSFLFIKIALRGMSPMQVALGRTVSGVAVLWLLIAARRLPVLRDARLWRHVAAGSVFATVLPFVGFAWAGERISSGMSGVYNATTPLMTLVVALLLLPEERATAERVGGVLLGLAGVAIVLGPWRGSDAANVWTGQLAALGSAASYGVGFNYTRRHLSGAGVPPLVLAASQLTVSTVALGVVTAVVGWEPLDLTPAVVGATLALGALGTGIAFVIYHGLIRDIGATSTSMVTFLIPLVAVALGVVVLDEPLRWNLFVGGAVVFGAVALAEGRLSRRARPPRAALAATTEAVPAEIR